LHHFERREWRRLLVLLDASGDRAAAVQAYEQFASHVSKELELAPAPETIRASSKRFAPAAARPSRRPFSYTTRLRTAIAGSG
jgi:DNA-binding SARP family transcriptional activator